MSRSPYGGAALAVVAMLCVQLGLAVSVGFDRQGRRYRGGLAATRVGWSAVPGVRPAAPRCVHTEDIRSVWALGVVTALISVLFMAAIGRIPLGTASAVEFLGLWVLPWPRAAGRGGSSGLRLPPSECCC